MPALHHSPSYLAEPVETFLGGHGVLEHVEADGTHELRVEGARRHGDLCVVCDGFLWRAVQLIQ